MKREIILQTVAAIIVGLCGFCGGLAAMQEHYESGQRNAIDEYNCPAIEFEDKQTIHTNGGLIICTYKSEHRLMVTVHDLKTQRPMAWAAEQIAGLRIVPTGGSVWITSPVTMWMEMPERK